MFFLYRQLEIGKKEQKNGKRMVGERKIQFGTD